jgi:UDP:flavonoid glycosyltransferase YjiC (YdhE family)
MDGLIYGVPQIICPGKVFERKYNADSVVKNGAGLCLSLAEFREDILFKTANRLISDKSFQKNAEMFGESLTSLGGEAAVISCINNRF